MSLNTWFRDYLYIPLGGNRKGPFRQSLNIFIIFVVSGIWHGASMTFVIWGAYHGLCFIFEQRTGFLRWLPRRLGTVWAVGAFAAGMIFFRSTTWEAATCAISAFGDWSTARGLFVGCDADFSVVWNVWVVLGYFSFLIGFMLAGEALFNMAQRGGRFASLPRWARWGFYYLLIFWILVLGAYGTPQQFIYFQF